MKKVIMLLVMAFYADMSAMMTPTRGNDYSALDESSNDLSPSGRSDTLLHKGDTPLHQATMTGDIGTIRIILATNPQAANSRNNYGETPLHVAAFEGNEEAVRDLIRAGAVVNAVDNRGDSPLHMAVLEGHTRVAKRLVNAGADVHLQNNDAKSPYDFAEISQKVDEMESILDRWLDRFPE